MKRLCKWARVSTLCLPETRTSTTQSTYSEIFVDYIIGIRISNNRVQLVDHNCVKSRTFEVCQGECWVPTLCLRETWNSATQSTYFEIFFAYIIGVRISNTHVQLEDHNCVRPRKFEVCHGECWVITHCSRETSTSTTVNIVWIIFWLHNWGTYLQHSGTVSEPHMCQIQTVWRLSRRVL